MSKRDINKIESVIGCPLPCEIRDLYEHHAGLPDWPMRLMSADEVVDAFQDQSAMESLRDSVPIWKGNDSDFAATYVLGSPLFGRVYYASKDNLRSIAFRSVESFQNTMQMAAEDGSDWYETITDYLIDSEFYVIDRGTCKPATPEEIGLDKEAQIELMLEYENADIAEESDELYYGLNIIALTPPEENETIAGFLNADNMYVQARACEVLGNRKYAPAIARLADVARNAKGNGKCAALDALADVGSPEALAEICDSIPFFSSGHGWLIVRALEKLGCVIRNKTEYRLPESDHWHAIKFSDSA